MSVVVARTSNKALRIFRIDSTSLACVPACGRTARRAHGASDDPGKSKAFASSRRLVAGQTPSIRRMSFSKANIMKKPTIVAPAIVL